MKNIVKIKKEYGYYILTDPDGTEMSFKTFDEFSDYMESHINTYDNPKVECEMYVNDKDSIIDATDVLIIVAMSCWGKQLYQGDCIKLTMGANYVPEDK